MRNRPSLHISTLHMVFKLSPTIFDLYCSQIETDEELRKSLHPQEIKQTIAIVLNGSINILIPVAEEAYILGGLIDHGKQTDESNPIHCEEILCNRCLRETVHYSHEAQICKCKSSTCFTVSSLISVDFVNQ